MEQKIRRDRNMGSNLGCVISMAFHKRSSALSSSVAAVISVEPLMPSTNLEN